MVLAWGNGRVLLSFDEAERHVSEWGSAICARSEDYAVWIERWSTDPRYA
jgi:hypothetical protein